LTSPPLIPPLLIKERGRRFFKRGEASLLLSDTAYHPFREKDLGRGKKPLFDSPALLTTLLKRGILEREQSLPSRYFPELGEGVRRREGVFRGAEPLS